MSARQRNRARLRLPLPEILIRIDKGSSYWTGKPSIQRASIVAERLDRSSYIYRFHINDEVNNGVVRDEDEGVTWCRGWSGYAADALRTAVVLAAA